MQVKTFTSNLPSSVVTSVSPLWTVWGACQDGRARGKVAKAKGVCKVAGEVVSEAEVMFSVVEGQGRVVSLQVVKR